MPEEVKEQVGGEPGAEAPEQAPVAPETDKAEPTTGEQPAEKQTPEPNRGAIAAAILADPELPPDEYARACRDQAYLNELVDAHIELQVKPPETTAAKVESDKSESAKAEADQAEPEKAEGAGETGDKEKAKRSGSARLKVQNQNLRAQLEEEREERRRLEERLAAQAGPKAKPGEKPGEPETAARTKPKEADFETTAEFLEALADWKAEDRTRAVLAEERHQQEQRAAKQQQAKAQEVFEQVIEERLEQGRERYPDFDEVLESAPRRAVLTEVMELAIAHSPRGGDLVYWLAKNPQQAAKISILPPVAQAMQMARLEAALPSNGTPKAASPGKPTVSKAPPPPKPLGGATGRNVKDQSYYSDPERCPPSEFQEARRTGKVR